MPALTADEYAALRDDIAARGVVVPVVLDQHGRILDGHHRREIAAELGIDCPTEVHHVGDDEDARDVALALNLARRHLTREQRRELIAADIEARPGDSDRAIGRRVGCDHKTVGAVRRGEVPQQLEDPWPELNLSGLAERARASLKAHREAARSEKAREMAQLLEILDKACPELLEPPEERTADTEPLTREEAEQHVEQIRAHLDALDEDMILWLQAGRDPMVLVDMLMEGLRIMSAAVGHDEEFVGPIRRHLIEPRVRAVLGCAT